jgi:hypothetical protein
MPKRINNKSTKSKSAKRGGRSRGNQLPGDGKTFTLEQSVPRTMLMREPQIFKVLQNFAVQNWFTTSITLPTFTFVSFQFNQIAQYLELAAVFDQYRIVSAEVWITPQSSADISSAPSTGQLASVLDFDDATNLTSFAAAQAYSTCVTSPQTCGHYRHIKPRVAMAVYAPSAFTSFGNIAAPWIDAASPAVEHYGIKLAATTTSKPQVFDLSIRYHLELRSVR